MEVGRCHAQQGGTSAVIIVNGQDERIGCFVVQSHDVLVACVDEHLIVEIESRKILVAQSIQLLI